LTPVLDVEGDDDEDGDVVSELSDSGRVDETPELKISDYFDFQAKCCDPELEEVPQACKDFSADSADSESVQQNCDSEKKKVELETAIQEKCCILLKGNEFDSVKLGEDFRATLERMQGLAQGEEVVTDGTAGECLELIKVKNVEEVALKISLLFDELCKEASNTDLLGATEESDNTVGGADGDEIESD